MCDLGPVMLLRETGQPRCRQQELKSRKLFNSKEAMYFLMRSIQLTGLHPLETRDKPSVSQSGQQGYEQLVL